MLNPTAAMTLPRKIAFFFLCIAPFVAGALAAQRPLRELSFYPLIGGIFFVLILASAWTLGLGRLLSARSDGRLLAASGGLMMMPWAMISLFWTGLGTPWEAMPAENIMRYEVLAAGSIAVMAGLVLLSRILNQAHEQLLSALIFSLGLLAGAVYLTWNCFQAGLQLILFKRGGVEPAIAELNIILEVQLFFAAVLTYLAVALAAAGMTKAKLLSRRAAIGYLAFSVLALILICLRGIQFPAPNAGPAPWYETPGFIVGIPAMPWLMPFFLGIVLLRRASDGDGDLSL